jgi:signal transduction histidine kinase
MKIRSWLMISYFIVMVLPIAALYGIYVSLTNYDQKQSFMEYVEVSQLFSQLAPQLAEASLYQTNPRADYEPVNQLTDESLRVTLYRHDGLKLYSSLETPEQSYFYSAEPDQLYQGLNEIQMNHRTYSLKKPVFQDGSVVGIYEIVKGREEWLQGVNERTSTLFVIFSGIFLVIYVVVIILLHRKLNRPLEKLRLKMDAFAQGHPVETETKRSGDEIGELMGHFDEMRLQIDSARKELLKQQQEKEFIVASLSHDLKTPLTVIQAYTEALNGGKLSLEEHREYKAVLFEKLHYMKQMLDDLVMYNALSSARLNMEFVQVDGEEFFDMLLSGYEEAASAKGIGLTVEQAVSGTYSVDVKQMIRVADNLAGNALRHTDAGRMLWIGAASENQPLPEWIFPRIKEELELWRRNGTVFIFQNEGEAVPEAWLERIFEPFVQGEDTRGKGGSSGLGLNISKMIMELHGGKIRIWSKKGYGTLAACRLEERKE